MCCDDYKELEVSYDVGASLVHEGVRDGSEPGSEKIREIGIQLVNELDTVDLKSILAYTLLSTQFVTRIVLSPSPFAGYEPNSLSQLAAW